MSSGRTAVRYPNVVVRLTDVEEPMTILARVAGAMRTARVSDDEVHEFIARATTSTYDHLLDVIRETVRIK